MHLVYLKESQVHKSASEIQETRVQKNAVVTYEPLGSAHSSTGIIHYFTRQDILLVFFLINSVLPNQVERKSSQNISFLPNSYI